MSETPNELYYAKSHEWVRREEDGTLTVGITDHAQEALGDIVFVETPDVGDAIAAGDQAGVVESTKSASDIYTPVSGEVIAVNEELADGPELVNSEPYTEGWFFLPNRGWMWTNRSAYPYFFDYEDKDWMYFQSGEEKPKFYRYKTKTWLTIE